MAWPGRFSIVVFLDTGDFLDLDDVDFARAFAFVTLPDAAVSALILFATTRFLPVLLL